MARRARLPIGSNRVSGRTRPKGSGAAGRRSGETDHGGLWSTADDVCDGRRRGGNERSLSAIHLLNNPCRSRRSCSARLSREVGNSSGNGSTSRALGAADTARAGREVSQSHDRRRDAPGRCKAALGVGLSVPKVVRRTNGLIGIRYELDEAGYGYAPSTHRTKATVDPPHRQARASLFPLR